MLPEVTSFDFPKDQFVTWAFTRNPDICEQLGQAVSGCSVVEDSHVESGGYLTYCERVYLNPLTGTGPDWSDLISAWLYRLKLDAMPVLQETDSLPRSLPQAQSVRIFNGSVPLHFAHVLKTGGESLELHLAKQPTPHLSYAPCRAASLAQAWPKTTAPQSCVAASRAVSLALCAANCECCADDVLEAAHSGFRGTILRSPRAHVLSLLSHCHAAHHNTWQRILGDFPQYVAEGILRLTEAACDSHCSFEPDILEDLRSQLEYPSRPNRTGQVQVIPYFLNWQAHALTCSSSQGSLGQHFRDLRLNESVPSLDAALATLQRFEWVGLTDLFEHSICLLHFQANGSLPASCDCSSSSLKLPKYTHGNKALSPDHLQPDMLARIDAFTAVDAQLFAEALRLLLGRLRHVEEITGASLLRCIPWRRLWRRTRYVPGLWLDSDSYEDGFRM